MPATKTCKYCAMEIPAGAHICVHCRKPQGDRARAVLCATVAGIVAMVLVLGATSNWSSLVKEDWEVRIRNKVGGEGTLVPSAYIKGHSVRVGMTKFRVHGLIGFDHKVRPTLAPDGETELCVIEDGDQQSILYFKHDLLIAIQTR